MISTTGIAGLTLGGGLGWLMGKYGMAIDNLESAEVVLADGRVVTASDADDADLFWAIRGGGGNFGVVTSFEYRAHPVDMIFGGIAAHPLAAAGEVFDFYRQFTKSLPDELTAFAGLVHAPDGSGTKIVALPVCHCGDLQQAESDVRPLREFGPPLLDLIGPMPYPVINTLLDPGLPQGRAQLLEVGVLHGALRRGGPHDGGRVRGVAVDDERHGRRALPRRGDAHRPDGNGLPSPPTRLQPRARSANGSTRRRPTPTCDGCARRSRRSSRTWRRRCT